MGLEAFRTFPPLIAALFATSLGVVSLVAGRGRRVWRMFALYAFLLAGVAASALGAMVVTDPGLKLMLVRGAPTFGLLSLTAALLYIALLTERDYGMTLFGRRWGIQITQDTFRVRLNGRPVAGWVYLAIVGGFWCLIIGTIAFSDVFIRGVQSTELGFSLEFGPAVHWVAGLIIIAGLKTVFFLVQAYRESTRPAFKALLAVNLVAFLFAFVPSLLLHAILPSFGFDSRPFGFFGFAVAVTLFYLGIVRYQFASIEELNAGLEQKVEARTRNLQDANLRLAQAERMASLGQLVAGVAHQVNTPMGSVRSMNQTLTRATEQLRAQLGDGDASPRVPKLLHIIDEANQVIGEGTERINYIIERLRAFARLDEAELQRVDLNRGLEDTLALIEFPETVTVDAELGDVAPIMCDPGLLNQVWMNLLQNARRAVQGGGKIKIVSRQDEKSAVVEIRDSGPGIPEEHLPRLFEPGFTTDGVGVGVGLGLPICFQILRDHGGSIRAEVKEGDGAAFIVSLPRASDSVS